LNLQDPEKWRRYNWGVAKDEFTKRGYKVVGYETTVKLFERSGLPVEDTKSSREKYAALAKVMGVDAILVPYYGTFASSKNVFLYANTISYDAVATFQIYLAKQNDFFTRVDASGSNKYTAGILTSLGTALLFVPIPKTGSTPLPAISRVLSGSGFLIDLIQSLRSKDSRWKAAFKKGIQQGLKPFFASYPSSQYQPLSQTRGALLDEREEIFTNRQEADRQAVARNRICFLGGLSLSSVNAGPAPEDLEFNTRSGFGAGTFYERGLSESVAIRFESNYVQKGSRLTTSFFDEFNNVIFRDEARLKLAYIESTTMLTILPLTGAIRPYFMAGPTVSYLLNARISADPIPGIDPEALNEDITDAANEIDFGFTFGGGMRFEYVFLEGRYALGLNDIFNGNEVEEMNRGLQVMAGISLPF
jgi:hypothetical protein